MLTSIASQCQQHFRLPSTWSSKSKHHHSIKVFFSFEGFAQKTLQLVWFAFRSALLKSVKWKMMIVDLYNYLSDLPRHHIFFIFSVGYLFYYLIEVVKVSRFTSRDLKTVSCWIDFYSNLTRSITGWSFSRIVLPNRWHFIITRWHHKLKIKLVWINFLASVCNCFGCGEKLPVWCFAWNTWA